MLKVKQVESFIENPTWLKNRIKFSIVIFQVSSMWKRSFVKLWTLSQCINDFETKIR